MHLLPCPSCQTPITVAPSQAGNQTKCPSCDQLVAIPKLGELRNLPRSDQDDARPADGGGNVSVGRRSGFLVLGLIAVAGLVVATYCGIRWSQIDVPTTTDAHIAEVNERYRRVPPANLILEYEDMDQYDISLFQPYKYKKQELVKQAWGRNTLVAVAVAGVSMLAALALISTGRSKGDGSATDT